MIHLFISMLNIEGYCAEFNEVGRVIQNHEAAPCQKVYPNCKDAYSSLDAYKCQYAHTKAI